VKGSTILDSFESLFPVLLNRDCIFVVDKEFVEIDSFFLDQLCQNDEGLFIPDH